jgi:hypothetical protein
MYCTKDREERDNNAVVAPHPFQIPKLVGEIEELE